MHPATFVPIPPNLKMQKAQHYLCQLADSLLESRESIIEQWQARANKDPKMDVLDTISRREFLDHVPQVLDTLDKRLRTFHLDVDESSADRFREVVFDEHGLSRWQQGFDIVHLVRDWNHLRHAILTQITAIAEGLPEKVDKDFSDAVMMLADLIADGVSRSIERYEDVKRSEALSHQRDLSKIIAELEGNQAQLRDRVRESAHDAIGIIGIVTDLLKRYPAKGSTLESDKTELIQSGLENALTLLKDFRELSSLEAGGKEPYYEDTRIGEFIQKTLSPFTRVVDEDRVQILCAGDMNLVVSIDRGKTRRILQNLLHNAVKFTVDGKIAISWSQHEKKNRWSLAVTNSGNISLTPNALPFTQKLIQSTEVTEQISPVLAYAHETAEGEEAEINGEQQVAMKAVESDVGKESAKKPPVELPREGIGLTICKRLCDLLGGRLVVSLNATQDGLTAVATLPTREAEQKESRP